MLRYLRGIVLDASQHQRRCKMCRRTWLIIGRRPHPGVSDGGSMAKGDQRSEKLAKKPKKDKSEPKNSGSDRPVAPVTAVLPKGKLKNK